MLLKSLALTWLYMFLKFRLQLTVGGDSPGAVSLLQVHYGAASLSALSRLPAYFVFRAAAVEVNALAPQILQHAASLTASSTRSAAAEQSASSSQDAEQTSRPCAVLVMLDQPYAHASARLQQHIDRLRQQQEQPQQQAEGGSHDASSATAADVPIIVTSAKGGALAPTSNPLLSQPHERSCHKSSASSAATASTKQPSAGCCKGGYSSGLADESTVICSTQTNAEATTCVGHQDGAEAADAAPAASDLSELQPGLKVVAGKASHRCSQSAAGLTWQLPGGAALEDAAVVWVGEADSTALRSLQLTHASATWSVLNPATLQWQHGVDATLRRTLQRRYYLVHPLLLLPLFGNLQALHCTGHCMGWHAPYCQKQVP